MNQSKTTYGAKSPKDTARSRHAQHTNHQEATGTTVEPACRTRAVGRGIERREWRTIAYGGRIRAFYAACKWCYPDGAPAESEVETVVRSCHAPTTYHRPRNADEPTCEPQTDAPETDIGDTRISRDSINSVTDLQVGQWVIWKDRERPLVVVRATTEPDGAVDLSGPHGGKYAIEGRPEHRQPYYVFGDGYRKDIARVRAENPAETV